MAIKSDDTKGGSSAGPATDRYNDPVVDPTANVRELIEGTIRRIDDLREAERRFNELRSDHLREMAALRASHAEGMAIKESARLDSIRQVDREEVAKTAAQANVAIATLAKQTTDLATTLQSQVSSTAAAAETRRSADMSEVNKRVSALELASSATAGKQQVSDPALDKLTQQVALLIAQQASGSGGKAANSATMALAISGVLILIALATLASRFL